MRVAKSKGKPAEDKGKEKIVRRYVVMRHQLSWRIQTTNRELNKVYTNGTLVDEELLTDEQAGHCISIREDFDSKKNSSFGICALDSATSHFNLSSFDDDVCFTKLETMIRQLRPKEVIFTKVMSVCFHIRCRSVNDWMATQGQLVRTNSAPSQNHLAIFMPLDKSS